MECSTLPHILIKILFCYQISAIWHRTQVPQPKRHVPHWRLEVGRTAMQEHDLQNSSVLSHGLSCESILLTSFLWKFAFGIFSPAVFCGNKTTPPGVLTLFLKLLQVFPLLYMKADQLSWSWMFTFSWLVCCWSWRPLGTWAGPSASRLLLLLVSAEESFPLATSLWLPLQNKGGKVQVFQKMDVCWSGHVASLH